jgi:hypothetical protein
MTQAIRERCEKLFRSLGKYSPDKDIDLIEAFAREIRNEALDDACACFQDERERNARLVEVLEIAYAELRVWILKAIDRTKQGCDEGISTVPNSFAHEDLRVASVRGHSLLSKINQALQSAAKLDEGNG